MYKCEWCDKPIDELISPKRNEINGNMWGFCSIVCEGNYILYYPTMGISGGRRTQVEDSGEDNAFIDDFGSWGKIVRGYEEG